MRSNACVLIRILPEVREEQKNPAVAGPATPSTGPCGAHGASDDDLEVPHRAPSKSLSITSCKKMPDPLFCPLQDRGEKPGHVIRVVPEVKEEQENAAVAAPASAEHRPMWSSRCLYWTTGVPLGAPRVILLYRLRMCQLSSQSGTGPCGAHGTSGGLVKSHVEIPQN